MLLLYHATGVLVLPKPQKSSHVFPTYSSCRWWKGGPNPRASKVVTCFPHPVPKGEKERGAAGPPRHALSLPLLPPKAASLSRVIWF